MLIDIEHKLILKYDKFIRETYLELRVQPLTTADQIMRSFYLAVGPRAKVSRYIDWNGNIVHHFNVSDFHDRVEVVARSLVDVRPARPPIAALTGRPAPQNGALLEFLQFGGPVRRGRGLARLDREIPVKRNAPMGEQVEGIGHFIFETFEYRKEVTDYRSTTDHLIEHRAGVCQDFAHLMLGLLRLRSIPCRYVSGYLHVDQEEKSISQSHAWVEAHTADQGWYPFDPTHNQVPDERYVVVGYGRNYDDVPPNRGIFKGSARETLHAEVHTRESAEKTIAALHEEIDGIDLPVFREVPDLAAVAERRRVEQEGGPQQQQQQQQQQQCGGPPSRPLTGS